MKNKNIYSLGIITIFIFFIFSIQISFAQTADGACSGGATVLEKSCTFQKGVSRISGKCQVKDPRNPSLGLTCRSSIGSSCSGDTCENGLVCINEVCSRPRGTKTEGQSCSGNANECVAGLECRDFVCKKEGTTTGTGGVGTSKPSGTTTSSSPTTPSDSVGYNSPGGSTVSESGLVKCGVSRDCTICDIFILIRDIFNFTLGLLAALAVLSIVIGGIYVLTSVGNPGRVSEGYGIITNAVIGILLVISSFLLFSFLLVALGFQQTNFSAVFDFQDGQIFSVKCDTASTFNDRGTNGGGVATPSGPIDTGSLNVACLGDTTITGELSAVLRAISVYETPSRGGADSYTLPPNSATASGRYQIINSTWSGWSAAAGVSERTTSAYQASPASQDRAAAWWLRDNNITTCDSFAASARANVGSYRGACQWTPVPGCASCSNTRYCQPNDTTRAYPDFAQLCKTLDADNCP